MFLGATCVFAQKRACPIPPPSPYKHTAYIGTRYDAKTNAMRTVLEHPMKLGNDAEPIYLAASFSYVNNPDASAVAARTNVEFSLISFASFPRFRDAHVLRLFADGRELPRIAAERYGFQKTDDNHILEQTQVTLSSGALIELTEAKSVEITLGNEHFEFTSNHLEALRELVSLIRPPGFAPVERKDAYHLPGSGY
jgi:hypothetical protein